MGSAGGSCRGWRACELDKCIMARGDCVCSHTTHLLQMQRAIFAEDSFVADPTWDTRSQKTFGPPGFQERSRYKMIAIDWSTGIHWYTVGMYGMW